MSSTSSAAVLPDEQLGIKGEQTRQAILKSAIECFGRDGFRSTSVARIAREAGVGDTITYNYFANKETLFLAALDEDTAGVIDMARDTIMTQDRNEEWKAQAIFTIAQAIESHPLARRVVAGLEPHVTHRMMDIPALDQLRVSVADRLSREQVDGTIRSDIDPGSIANGIVTIWLALLMSIVQYGGDGVPDFAPDVMAVFDAALNSPLTST